MAIFHRTTAANEPSISPSPPSSKKSPTYTEDVELGTSANHQETVTQPPSSRWKLSRTGDGDTAMALFSDPDEIHEAIDPIEEKKLARKIDLMILPYLAVCYAFFYIDKTTLSYAAIFGIQKDLNLQGTQYSWLSSIFYFGFLAWAFPTNFLMQRLPIGKSHRPSLSYSLPISSTEVCRQIFGLQHLHAGLLFDAAGHGPQLRHSRRPPSPIRRCRSLL